MSQDKPKVYLSETVLQKRVEALAMQISQDFKGEEVVLIGILSGSFIFLADLVRKLDIPVIIEFISLSSYENTQSTGQINFRMDVKIDLDSKNVIVVEDIVDTGLTVQFLLKHLQLKKPKVLKLCSLLLKRARLKTKIDIDYLGFDIDDKFVIGYGLDYNGLYRELPYVGVYGES